MNRGLRWFKAPQLAIILVTVLLCLSVPAHVGHRSARALQQARNYVAPASTQAIPHIPRPTPLHDLSCAQVACLALTFDDGPNPIATPIVLQALEQAHAHATFFVVGSRAITMPYLLQRMHRDGDEIGDHSWSHPDMTKLTATQVNQQIAQTQAAVTAAGVPAPTLFRPPYGFVNATMQQQIHLPFILWNDDSKDWASHNPAQIIATVEAEAKPGSIVDMHDIYTTTGQALPQLLTYLQARYKLVTVSQLLNLTPASRGEYYGR